MIQHIVLCDLRPDHDPQELKAVMDGLRNLQGQLPGFTDFSAGPNRDFESMSPGYGYGFVCKFADIATAQAYLVNPDHQALGARLVGLCSDGVKGLRVIDLETEAV
ncbi:Dabb family protein [Yoonia sp.]|uniref:Dabb family protein n=1 Tax=Yoonia sp. TaxID=2212373 RepID=UPI0019F62C6B|nr:Dabb family protein [Yoonia sp.]MBE0413378.1 Dabb family protein [Yoonia sp.]